MAHRLPTDEASYTEAPANRLIAGHSQACPGEALIASELGSINPAQPQQPSIPAGIAQIRKSVPTIPRRIADYFQEVAIVGLEQKDLLNRNAANSL